MIMTGYDAGTTRGNSSDRMLLIASVFESSNRRSVHPEAKWAGSSSEPGRPPPVVVVHQIDWWVFLFNSDRPKRPKGNLFFLLFLFRTCRPRKRLNSSYSTSWPTATNSIAEKQSPVLPVETFWSAFSTGGVTQPFLVWDAGTPQSA